MTWFLLAGAILTEVAATLSLRASEGFRNKRWIAPVAVFYAAAFTLLTVALANGMPVGIAYGIWAASGVALTAIGARVFFGERLTWRMAVGIVFIALGVFVIELGSQSH
ncbi:DMT family transporter [Agromyces albus]|uniref:Multidrug efflux SMR transporter n=1 Tax=Agromyces albus TaxID=205332 RepID=A0A4Q2KTV1_9MICO|nr:multidrug efflux SMR transporter [Agromyces albus]RXZ68259.1 multidrug efflux SMR transporter [Agromyces albus]